MRERNAYNVIPIPISAERISSFEIKVADGLKNAALKKYTTITMIPDANDSLAVDNRIFRPPINPNRFLKK